MHSSRPVTILALMLVLTFGLSTACFALHGQLSAPTTGQTPGGCHGHHGPMPQPAHSCCYAGQQITAPVQFAPSPVALHTVVGSICGFDTAVSHSGIAPAVQENDSSPPSRSVLRI